MPVTRCPVLAAMTTVLAAASLGLADETARRPGYRAEYTLHVGAPDGQRVGSVSVDLRPGHWRGRDVLVMRSVSVTGGGVGTNLVIMDEADHRVLFKRAEGHDASIAVAIHDGESSFTRLPFDDNGETGTAQVPDALIDLLALEPALAARGFPERSELHLLEGGIEPRPATVRVSREDTGEGEPRWQVRVPLERGAMTCTMVDHPPFALAREIEAGPARIHWTLDEWEQLD